MGGSPSDGDERDDEQPGGDDVDGQRLDREDAARRAPGRRRRRSGRRRRAARSPRQQLARARARASAPLARDCRSRRRRRRAAATPRNGHSRSAPLTVIEERARRAISDLQRDATAATARRDTRSASWPAGSARSGSGRNSASPTRPRSSGLLADRVDLPADRDGDHLRREAVRERAPPRGSAKSRIRRAGGRRCLTSAKVRLRGVAEAHETTRASSSGCASCASRRCTRAASRPSRAGARRAGCSRASAPRSSATRARSSSSTATSATASRTSG